MAIVLTKIVNTKGKRESCGMGVCDFLLVTFPQRNSPSAWVSVSGHLCHGTFALGLKLRNQTQFIASRIRVYVL